MAALAGLVGRRVAVVGADRGGKPIVVMRMEGVLGRAQDMSFLPHRPDAEAQFFYVGADRDNERLAGFMLHAGCFGGGDAPGVEQVRFLQGAVLVTVRAEDDPDPDAPTP